MFARNFIGRTTAKSTISIRGLLQKRFISLQTIQTPNENALKFVSRDFKFLPEDITNAVEVDDLPEASVKSPLATELFKINGVMSLMIGPDFVTVNKVESTLANNPELEWSHLSNTIINVISNAIENKKLPVLNEVYLQDLYEKLDDPQESDDDIVFEIKELINTRIRPALQDDGGDIHFRSFDEESGTVYIKLKGACKSCSLSEDTLKNGIESMLKHYVPEVEQVKGILDPEEEIAIAAFEKFESKMKNREM